MHKIGRKTMVLIGVIMMTAGTLTFAIAGYEKNALSFFLVSLVARILQGLADAIISVTVPSIIAIEWPENQELYLGYNTMSNGIGCSFGPLLGSLVYAYLSYVSTFYFFTVYMFVLGMGAVLLIPTRINAIPPPPDRNSVVVFETISYCEILKNRGAITTLFACMISSICLIYMDPTLSVRLTDMGMSSANVGVAFALMGLCFGIGSAFAGWICNIFSRLVVM